MVPNITHLFLPNLVYLLKKTTLFYSFYFSFYFSVTSSSALVG